MKSKDLLDPIEDSSSSRLSKLSFRAFLLTLLILLIFLIAAFINPGFSFFEYVVVILALGFIFSNVAGLVFTIRSIINKEPDTTYKTIGAVGNILFFFVVLGMVSFVVMDLFSA